LFVDQKLNLKENNHLTIFIALLLLAGMLSFIINMIHMQLDVEYDYLFIVANFYYTFLDTRRAEKIHL
jgi:hypothetical protein